MVNSKKTELAGLLLAGILAATSAQAQHVAANVADSLSGTYALTYQYASGASPYENGETVTFVVNGATDTLCIDGTLLSNPYLASAGGQEEIWSNAAGTVFYALSHKQDGSMNEINVSAPTEGKWVGQFKGDRTSTSTTCAASGSEPESDTTYTENGISISVDEKSIMDLALELYPGVFKKPGLLREYQGYFYRYYATTKTYIGLKGGKVFVMGGAFGDVIVEYGDVNTILIDLQGVKNDKLDVASGDYDLTITGKYTSTLITIDIPRIAIKGIAAPDPTDVEAIIKQAKDLGASNVQNVKVQTINNSASRVTFTVEFTGTLTGLGVVNYLLNYDYVK